MLQYLRTSQESFHDMELKSYDLCIFDGLNTTSIGEMHCHLQVVRNVQQQTFTAYHIDLFLPFTVLTNYESMIMINYSPLFISLTKRIAHYLQNDCGFYYPTDQEIGKVTCWKKKKLSQCMFSLYFYCTR